jgi:hypothetical protein
MTKEITVRVNDEQFVEIQTNALKTQTDIQGFVLRAISTNINLLKLISVGNEIMLIDKRNKTIHALILRHDILIETPLQSGEFIDSTLTTISGYNKSNNNKAMVTSVTLSLLFSIVAMALFALLH